MCVHWTDDQWLERSQPASPHSAFRVLETRYNAAGQIARTYLESDGWAYGVLPGLGNRAVFFPENGHNPVDEALAHIESRGFTLMEPPTKSLDTPAASGAGTGDLVENLA